MWTRIEEWDKDAPVERSRLLREVGAVFSQAGGALLRAFFVTLFVATPSLLMGPAGPDGAQVVALIALSAGVLTFVEYVSHYPSLIEFRDAPPFNRIRFLSLFFTVFILSAMLRETPEPSGLDYFVDALGFVAGHAFDFPFSPVRLVVLALPPDAPMATQAALRSAAGMAFVVGVMAFTVFYCLLKIWRWPSATGAFNVWINLPTFDPTAGGDVVDRLRRDARINLALGFLLPFLIPAVGRAATMVFGSGTLDAPQTLVWAVTIWAFLPLSLLMRGIAMGRVAEMICDQRRRRASAPAAGPIPA